MESILTLLHKYNDLIKGLDDKTREYTILSEIAKKRKIPIEDVLDEEVERVFIKSKRRKVLDIYMTKSTFKKYSGMFDLFNSNYYNIHIVEDGYKKTLTHNTRFGVIAAKHNDILSDRDSVGFIIYFDGVSLIYTGDTGWNPHINNAYVNLYRREKSKYRILVAHLGGFKKYEDNYLLESKRTSSFYKNHLGRLGLAKLNSTLKPDLCIISEFGEELKESRIDLSEIYQTAFKDDIKFIPADIGLKIDVTNKMVQAITDIDVDKKKINYTYVNPKKIKCQLSRKDYSLHYYDASTNMDVGDLVFVISENFDGNRK